MGQLYVPKLSTRSIRTFVLRQGRLTEGQQRSLGLHWNTFGIEPHEDRIELSEHFDKVAPVWMEIGFGDGAALGHMAEHNPEVNFLGVEVHLPGVGHALGEITQRELTNVRLVRYDVLDLIEHFLKPASVDRVLVYFPDPWHKTRHRKRRLVNAGFLDMMNELLVPDGVIHFATDWVPYAQEVRAVVEAHTHFSCLGDEAEAAAIAGLRPETRFEQRGQRLGHDVSDLVIRKLPA